MYIDDLEALEATSSRTDKERILANANSKTIRLLIAAFDPYQMYYIKRVPKVTEDCPKQSAEVAAEALMLLLETLSERVITGSEAKAAVSNLFSTFDAPTYKWLSRVLLKNMRIGVTAKTLNKIYPNSVRTFEVMLAKDTEVDRAAGKILTKIKYPVWCDYKLDGIRMVAIKRKGVCILYTRAGHVIETVPHINAAIEAMPLDNIVFDGEVLGRDWNDTQSVLSAATNPKDAGHMTYSVFDTVSLDVWDSHMLSASLEQRLLDLAAYDQLMPKCIQTVAGRKCRDEYEVWAFNRLALELGYEGSMIKDMSAAYPFKRSSAVLKLKPKLTVEGIITGWALGEEGSKWADGFGAFHVRLELPGLEPTTVSVGGGYTDELRAQIYNNPKDYVGRIMEIECQEVTKDGSLRFPVFKRFRSAMDKS